MSFIWILINHLRGVEDWRLVLEDIGVDYDELLENPEDVVWELNRKDYGGGMMDIIYYKPFRESLMKFGYDVIIWEDSGNQDTTGLVYIPLYKDKVHFVGSTPTI